MSLHLHRGLLRMLVAAALLLAGVAGGSTFGGSAFSASGAPAVRAVSSPSARVSLASTTTPTARPGASARGSRASGHVTASPASAKADPTSSSVTATPRAARASSVRGAAALGLLPTRRGPPSPSFVVLVPGSPHDAVPAAVPSPGFARGPPSSA
jgi:hypothetical protein